MFLVLFVLPVAFAWARLSVRHWETQKQLAALGAAAVAISLISWVTAQTLMSAQVNQPWRFVSDYAILFNLAHLASLGLIAWLSNFAVDVVEFGNRIMGVKGAGNDAAAE